MRARPLIGMLVMGSGDRVAVTGKLAVDGDSCSLREPVTLAAP